MEFWLVTSCNRAVRNICKEKNLVSTLLTAVAMGQVFHDAISQRSWFSPHLFWRNSTGAAWAKLVFMCNLLSHFCPENFVLYFSVILCNQLQDNFLQRKHLLGFISMTLGYLLQFKLHKLGNQVLPVVASPSIHSIVQYNLQFSQAIWQLQVFHTACYGV